MIQSRGIITKIFSQALTKVRSKQIIAGSISKVVANTPILSADIGLGPYLMVADNELNILSVFDELRYDRSDADMMSPAMRRHVVEKLKPMGFRQKSGNIIEHSDSNTRCIIPKSHALGASPFDILRYTKKREQDFYILTSTQTACQFVDIYSAEEAVERIGALIAKQPININRLYDYLDDSETHRIFLRAVPHLIYLQRMALESEPLCRIRPLK